MKLKENNFGVAILCTDGNIGNFKYTSNYLKTNYPEVQRIAVLPRKAHEDDEKEFSKYCPVVRGGKTITSLMDAGLKEIQKEWCLILMAGSRFHYNVFKKYSYFEKGDKDILYLVVDRKWIFDEASINGILVNKNVVKDVGEFGDEEESLPMAKLVWADRAMKQGYQLKAIIARLM